MMQRLIPIFALAGLAFVLAATPALAQGWGTIKGRIVWDDSKPIPERKPYPSVAENKDGPECVKANKGPIRSEEWVINPKTKGIRWVFVWLAPTDPKQKLPIHPKLRQVPTKPVELDQPCCIYVPHAFGIREGQNILAKNSAGMAHNVNWTGLPTVNPGSNVQLPKGGTYEIKGLVADRIPVLFKCNIHGWMTAYCRVFDHPYFAITDEDGNFEIKDAPAGDFRLVIWHETGYLGGVKGRQGKPISIQADKVTDVGKLEWK